MKGPLPLQGQRLAMGGQERWQDKYFLSPENGPPWGSVSETVNRTPAILVRLSTIGLSALKVWTNCLINNYISNKEAP